MEFAGFVLNVKDPFFRHYWNRYTAIQHERGLATCISDADGDEVGPNGWQKRVVLYTFFHYAALLAVRKTDYCMKKCESALRGSLRL